MRLLITLMFAMILWSCKDHKKAPDVSAIKVDLETRRFEKELFSLDTNHLAPQLEQLIAKYPSFGENFITTILSTDPRWSTDSADAYIGGFISSYRSVYDTAEKVFSDISVYKNEIADGLRFVHYYFPQYKTPHNIITYIGPLNGFGDILSEDAFIIGLHCHLGKNYSGYHTSWVQDTYPEYMTTRFEPSYISVNCMKNIVTDIYPEKSEDKSLIVQMIEKGKRLYMLNKLLPVKEEYKLIGYTEKQLKDCYANEAGIWNMFVQNNFLQTVDNNVIKNYVNEGPKTQELGDDSPGNIGSFEGWQIVRKYVEKNPSISLPKLMETDAEIIFQEARYKP